MKGFAHTLLLLIILLGLSLFGGYWLFVINQESGVVQEKIASPQSSPLTTIFKDQATGLEFPLPQGFFVKEETEEEYFKRANGNIRKNFTYYVQYSPPEFVNSFYVMEGKENNPDKARLAILIFKNPDNLDPQNFYKQYWYYPFVWGEFSSGEKNKIAPGSIKLVAGREAGTAVVDFRPGKPEFIYLPFGQKDLMLQIQLPTENNREGKRILESFKLE